MTTSQSSKSQLSNNAPPAVRKGVGRKVLAAAALAALPTLFWSSSAFAQARTNDDGHLLDSSNRLGGYGRYNTNPSAFQQQTPYGTNSNQVIYGDVTNGRRFVGASLPAPDQFRQRLPGTSVANFTRDSTGVPLPNQATQVPNQSTPYFPTDARGVNPPPGFVQPLNQLSGAVPAGFQPRQLSDSRLGLPLTPGTIQVLPRAGELVLPGPVDPTNNLPSVLTASPLYGVRQSIAGDASDQYFLRKFSTALNSETAAERQHVDPRLMQQMRDELMVPSEDPDSKYNPIPNSSTLNPTPASQKVPGAGAGARINDRMPNSRPLGGGPLTDSPSDVASNGSDASNGGAANSAGAGSTGEGGGSRTLGSPRITGAVATGSANTGEGIRGRMLKPAVLQSARLKQMHDNLEKMYGQTLSPDMARAMLNNTARRLEKEAAGKAGGPNLPAVGAAGGPNRLPPGGPATPAGDPNLNGGKPLLPPDGGKGVAGLPGDLRKPAGERPKPIAMANLYDDIQGKGLHDTMKKAEDLMKQGKFTAAVDQYDLAQQLAPNNPLVWVGRGTAELGGSFYGLADRHLRQAFASDPSLLLAQYDLRTLLGEERLNFLVKDLKEASTKDEKATAPLFLLAYIAYNTGSERRALGYLDMAEKRADGKDVVIQMVKDHWNLPTDSPTQPTGPLDMNK